MRIIFALSKAASLLALGTGLVGIWYWASQSRWEVAGFLLVVDFFGFIVLLILLGPSIRVSRWTAAVASSGDARAAMCGLLAQSLLAEAAIALFVVGMFWAFGWLTGWLPMSWTVVAAVSASTSPQVFVVKRAPPDAYSPSYALAVSMIAALVMGLALLNGVEPTRASTAALVVFALSYATTVWQIWRDRASFGQGAKGHAGDEDNSVGDLMKLQFKLDEAMVDVGDGVNADYFPNGAGAFGVSAENPIPCKSIIGCHVYLEALRTMEGAKIRYVRVGSASSPHSQWPVDMYSLSIANGMELCVLYLSPYQRRNSRRAPLGFVMTRGTSE